jgi:deoxycytidylate deaminase
MVCPWAACCDCARSIICAGIKTLVVHKERMDMTPEHWRADVDDALNMLSEAAVEIIHFEGPVRGALPILADGKLWSPETLSFVGTA